MGRGPSPFTERGVRAAIKAVLDAGCTVSRVEIDKSGKIVIVAGKPESVPDSNSNPWDDVLHGNG
jgi:hypothetical protein